jgi:K+-sensing histidine kinase KdpD
MFSAHRIVAGISGSPGSVHAYRQAAGLARHHDAPLIAVHA